jgi:cytochrome c556
MNRLLLAALVAGFGVAASVSAQAQSADAAIAARKAGMELQTAVVGAAKRAIDAKEDVKPFKDGANAIAMWGKAAPGLFIAGSDKGDTKALPAAFSDPEGLAKAGLALNAAALKLAAAADANDKDAFAAAFKEVGAACGACHRTYRQR